MTYENPRVYETKTDALEASFETVAVQGADLAP